MLVWSDYRGIRPSLAWSERWERGRQQDACCKVATDPWTAISIQGLARKAGSVGQVLRGSWERPMAARLWDVATGEPLAAPLQHPARHSKAPVNSGNQKHAYRRQMSEQSADDQGNERKRLQTGAD